MKEKLSNLFIMSPFIWLFSGLLFFGNGDKLMVIFILVSITVSSFHYGFSSIRRNLNDKGLWLLTVVVLYSIFSYYYHGYSSSEIRALLSASLLLIFFPRKVITRNDLKWLIFLGSLTIAFSTYYFSEYLHIERSLWPINGIPHSTMGAVIAILALTFFIHEKNTNSRIVFLLSLFMAVTSVLINQTRGVWLALTVSITIILFLNISIKSINWKFTLLTIAILFVGIYIAAPKIKLRVEQTQGEITKIQSNNFDSSFGVRLQLWNASPKIISEQPVIGSGYDYNKRLEVLASEGYLSKDLIRFSHFHNQYIDRLVKNGFIGLVLLFAILLYPLIINLSVVNKQFCIGIVIIYAIGGLTDVPLNHGSSLLMYLLLIFVLKIEHEEAMVDTYD